MHIIKLGIGLLLAASTLACGMVVDDRGPDAAPNPAGTAISPDHGPLEGGTTVTLSGSGFQGGEGGDTRVVVGGVEASNVVVVSDTELTFDTPPGGREGDIVDVTAFSQAGFTTLALAYRYNAVPVVLGISPASGTIGGGTSVTVTGHGFQVDEAGTPSVLIGDSPLTSVQVVDDETITGTTTAFTGTPFARLGVRVDNANGDADLEEAFFATKPGILAMERAGQARVRWIDPTNGAVAELPQLGATLQDCVRAPDGELYCTTGAQLVKLDPLSGVATPIGPTTNATAELVKIRSLAVAGTTVYGLASRSGPGAKILHSIDLTTGAITAVSAALTITGSPNIAAKDDTSLYMADFSNAVLRTVTTAGVVTAGPTMNGDGARIYGMATIGGVTYFSERNTSLAIFTVNTTSGVVTSLATLPFRVHVLTETPASF
jgi:hypothetical protein